ncbi:uncharacterized protein K02A2.6-like [Wyeomyia smithii]|uniref:uncharacterized protein K02A2.6-like n=1 Tax=Wyeomyia smithii TaxID=174621 RepID=UPI002467E49B|nr:uncharacterized protein K02A2.6-like [Wyeomyia smithii]
MRQLPCQPWHDLAMDFLGPLPSGESILVLIDMYSRYRVVEAMDTTTSDDIINVLTRIFFRLGIPEVFISDNAKNFSSSKISAFGKKFGIQLEHTIPYWPRSNGEVERQNRSILKILRIAQVNGTDWKHDLEEANYVYSMINHPATGRSPAEMAFGRKFKDWIPEVICANDNFYAEIKDHDWIYKQKSKTRYDTEDRTEESNLQPRDRVLMRNLVSQNKLSSSYNPEPATVLEKKGNSVLVQMDNGKRYRRNSAHVKKLVEPEGVVEVSQQKQQCSNNDTPFSEIVDRSLTPAAEFVKNQSEQLERPRREVKRPSYFEDYEIDI